MKRINLMMAALLVAGTSFAQKDTTTQKADTIRIGTTIIIKKSKDGEENKDSLIIKRVSKKKSNITTNWWIFDVGFANVNDNTKYGTAEAASYLKTTRPGELPFNKNDMSLRTGKTTNVNIWLFMQRLNITKNILNLKYGLGVEMFNFRYDNNISYHKSQNGMTAFISRDSISFSKNKLYAGYVSVPLMINVNTSPGRKKGFSFSAGITGGYLIGSRNKQKSGIRGKVKERGDLDLEQFRLAYTGELGLGKVKLFGSYSINPMHERGLVQYPYSLGIRFSSL